MRRRSFLIAASAWSILGPAQRGGASTQISDTFVPSSNVTFVIAVPETTYRISVQIPVTYRIRNVGTTPLHVPRGFAATACLERETRSHLAAWLVSDQGAEFRTGYGSSCGFNRDALPDLVEHLSRGADLVAPGQSVEGVLEVSTTAGTGPRPGSYTIHATLLGWTGQEFSARNREQLVASRIRLLGGTIEATPVPVTLIPF